jgi:hypothetical protein
VFLKSDWIFSNSEKQGVGVWKYNLVQRTFLIVDSHFVAILILIRFHLLGWALVGLVASLTAASTPYRAFDKYGCCRLF